MNTLLSFAILLLTAGVPAHAPGADAGSSAPLAAVTTTCHDWQQNTIYGACAAEAPGTCTEAILAAALQPLNNKNANTTLDGLIAAYEGCNCTYRWMGGSSFEVTYAAGGGVGDLIVEAELD